MTSSNLFFNHNELDELSGGINDQDLVVIISDTEDILPRIIPDILFCHTNKKRQANIYTLSGSYFDLLKYFNTWLNQELKLNSYLRSSTNTSKAINTATFNININDSAYTGYETLVSEAEKLQAHPNNDFFIVNDFKLLALTQSVMENEKNYRDVTLHVSNHLQQIPRMTYAPLLLHTNAFSDYGYYEKLLSGVNIHDDDLPVFYPLYQKADKLLVIHEWKDHTFQSVPYSDYFFHGSKISLFMHNQYVDTVYSVATNYDLDLAEFAMEIQDPTYFPDLLSGNNLNLFE